MLLSKEKYCEIEIHKRMDLVNGYPISIQFFENKIIYANNISWKASVYFLIQENISKPANITF